MGNHLVQKLNSPRRIAELNPAGTLQRIGFHAGDTLCDIGAGTGIFTFAAAGLADTKVYAVDISAEMRQVLREERDRQRCRNVIVANALASVPSTSCNFALLCTVWHEVYDKAVMATEIKRTLAPGGSLVVIEFHKRGTNTGPPMEIRLDKEDVAGFYERYGLRVADEFSLGEDLYGLVLR